MPEKDKVTRDKIRIPIRTALMPVYYKDFCCIMGACQDNCCDDGWKIEFSKKDYLAIKRAVEEAEGFAESGLRVLETADLASAVTAARDTAREGDVVVLSPACAAFDQFKNFMERGKVFKRLVNAL